MTQPTRKRREFRICAVCGVEFLVQREGQRGCSRSCAHFARRLTEPGLNAPFEEKHQDAEKLRP